MKLSTALIILGLILMGIGLILMGTGIIHSVESAHERAAYIAGCVEGQRMAMKSDSRMQGIIIKECEQNWENYKERNR